MTLGLAGRQVVQLHNIMMAGPPNYILLPFTGAIYTAAATAVIYINSIHSTTVHTLTYLIYKLLAVHFSVPITNISQKMYTVTVITTVTLYHTMLVA